MDSPISAETHKEFKVYSADSAVHLYQFIDELRKYAKAGKKTPYNSGTFIRHANVNRHTLKAEIDAAITSLEDVKISASILFWVYRGCMAMSLQCPVELPHICKIFTNSGEKFYVTSKEDWAAHRDATLNQSNVTTISDHAKLQFLTRVVGLDIDKLLKTFPFEKLKTKGRLLEDGRYEHTVGSFLFIMDGNVCVSVLNKGMIVT